MAIGTKVFARWLFLGGKVRFCLNGKTKARVPLRLRFPRGSGARGLRPGHAGQLCANPLLETGVWSGKGPSSGRGWFKPPQLTLI